MHSYESGGVVFHFNSDWSGNLVIEDAFGEEGFVSVVVPAEAILDLVAEKYIKNKLMERVESAEGIDSLL